MREASDESFTWADGADRRLVVFTIEQQRYAVELRAVQRVVAMVHVTPLPRAPGAVSGVINVRGQLVPTVDLRHRLGLPARAPTLADRLVLVRTTRRTLALAVDRVVGVLEDPGAIVATRDVLPDLPQIHGIARLEDGLVLIHDLERFLTPDEEQALDRALATS